MPAKNRSRTNKAAENNVPAEEIKDDATMIDDETVTGTPEEVVNDTPPAEVNDAPDNSETKSESETQEDEKFTLPANPADLKLSDDFAEVIGQRLLTILAQINENNAVLKAQAAGDDSAAVISYAESVDASDNIKGLLEEFNSLKAQVDTLFSQITAAVKTEKGDVQLSEKEIDDKKELHKKLIKSAKHAHVAYMDYSSDNECGPDVVLFGKTIEGMIGGRAPSTAKTSSGTYKQSTNVRPRLGDNGYIKVGDTKYDTPTLAVKAIHKLDGGKDINVGQIHSAWIKAALNSDDTSKWTDVPKDVETNFTVGSEDKPIKVAVLIAS